MFDDDFESMLEAVCEVAGSDIPKLPKPRPKSRKQTPPKRENKLSKPSQPQDNYEYVPPESTPEPPPKAEPTYDRSRHIMSSMKSSVVKERLSAQQVEGFRKAINHAKAQHGGIHASEKDFPYIDVLYPREAVEAMLLAGTKHWPGFQLDDVLEGFMFQFLKDRPDIQEFVKELGDAIYDNKVMEGVMLRLNLQTIASPAVETISIRTQFGTVTQTKIPRRTAFMGELRQKMKFFLEQQGSFSPHINVVYRGLERIDQIYTLDQKILSWMGYIVTRSMAENSKQQKLKGKGGNNLLLETKI